jgi:hypothetical protein
MTTRRKFTAIDLHHPCMDCFPKSLKLALINQHSIPDAVMFNEETNVFTKVEVKYCRDTDKATQRAKATKQHQHMCDSIADSQNHEDDQPEERDTGMADLSDAITLSWSLYGAPTVRQVTIPLGVTVVIYTDTVVLLTALGISGPALKTLLTDLHYTAIHGLERIWRQRGALIRHLGHLKRVNYSRVKKTYRKRGCKAPSHRKSNKKRKHGF